MSLAQKLTFKIVALVAALALIGSVSVWGLMGLSRHFDSAEDEYQQLRAIYEIGHHAAVARTLIFLNTDNGGEVRKHLRNAIVKAEALLAEGQPDALALSSNYQPSVVSIRDWLDKASRHVSHAEYGPETLADINHSLANVADLGGRIRSQIVSNRQEAKSQYRRTVATITTLTLIVVLAAALVGFSQYRSVMRPLRRLEQGVRRVTDGDFARHIPAQGDREFARLARQFNDMADQLDTLYQRMDRQVKTKSRQLVRSQKLASVGFLAAGLAHEINNPLGIIAGYSEAALQRLNNQSRTNNTPLKIESTLRIICEEAFRCKEITAKLLSLSSPPTDERTSVCLSQVAHRVAQMLAGLPRFRTVRVTVETSGLDDAVIYANEGQITQVMVNLITNALEAVDPVAGRVGVRIKRAGTSLSIHVEDNGRGMTEQVLQKSFEPFYTDTSRHSERGIGLGLSVTHAIVEQHGGSIDARSEGPGKGSTFTVELPAVSPSEVLVHA